MWSASRYQEDVDKLHSHKICESKEIEETLRTEKVSIPPNMNTSPHAMDNRAQSLHIYTQLFTCVGGLPLFLLA